MRNRPINPAWRLICRRYQSGAAAGCGDGDGRRRQWRSGNSTAVSSDWRRCNRRRRTTDEGETAALHSTARMAAVLRATTALDSGEGETAAFGVAALHPSAMMAALHPSAMMAAATGEGSSGGARGLATAAGGLATLSSD
ncbi:unnamed protein product [Cuscuta campestris]|uniref:Uncharacterized protein n=1 Tax=Cuscuta campestris TaxID=132261 RepID=A0A484N4F3_9ASTE|nr:unnamed protein product [Cuscuta campestris]